MKREEQEEDAKAEFYYNEKNRLEIEKAKREEERKKNERLELQKYLDMQIQERKKEEEFLKSLDDEQARILQLDCQKRDEQEREIDRKIKAMNKRNLEILSDQIKSKKKASGNVMSEAEYAMNRDMLEKAKVYSMIRVLHIRLC